MASFETRFGVANRELEFSAFAFAGLHFVTPTCRRERSAVREFDAMREFGMCLREGCVLHTGSQTGKEMSTAGQSNLVVKGAWHRGRHMRHFPVAHVSSLGSHCSRFPSLGVAR